ncbi:hypothetical protein [Streptomyces sp. NPDC089799]|uniref:hypothetical protein n=1 Tax=Streptomyces sp. NPDC089799 TaxID=3155066 RepID=UPI0034446C2A
MTSSETPEPAHTPEPADTADTTGAAGTAGTTGTGGTAGAAGAAGTTGAAGTAETTELAAADAPAAAAGRGARRRPALLAGAVAAAVLLVGGGTAYWAASAHGDGTKPGTAAAMAARDGGGGPAASPSSGKPGNPGIAPGEPDPSGGGVVYEARNPLPQGPGSAPAFKAGGEVTEAEVARLAAKLGIGGTPRLSGAQWVAGQTGDSGGPLLRVTRQAPGTWSFTAAGPAGGDDCRRGKDTCGPATLPGAGDAGDPGPAVTEDAAKAAAGPVLEAIGQRDAKLDARLTQGAVRVVVADPVIGGLPTQGWSARISVGPAGTVVAGSGELKAPERAGERSVITATAALDKLNAAARPPVTGPSGCATPVPLEDPSAPSAVGTDTVPCNPEPRPIKPPRTDTVEKAVLGLAPATVDGVRGLEPAWLFEVAGRNGAPGRTVAQAAVAEPGQDGVGRMAVPGFSYDEADRKLTVHFWGGVCSTYALEVRESTAAVSVRITDTPKEPGRACILIAQEMSLSATLKEPLGGRPVIDATTAKELARTS